MSDEPEKESLKEAVELEEISQCKRRIKFTVPIDEVEKELDAAYEEVKDTAAIPGFRPGKAPRHVVEMRMGKAFREAALSRVRHRAVSQAILRHHLHPVGSARFENIVYERGKPFTFEATLEVTPDITLPEYKGIKIERIVPLPTAEAELTELDRIRERFAKVVPVEDRSLRDGDIALVSYEEEADGKIEKFERESIEIAEGFVLPGFVEKVRGMKSGEKRDFQIQVPEGYRNEQAAGKVVSYRLQLHEIKTKVVPETDDAFAKSIHFDSLESLKKHIHRTLTESRERDAEREEVSQVMTYLLRNTDFEVPESLVVEETRRRASGRVDAAFRAGISEERIRERREELIKNAAAEAYADLKAQIIIVKIAEKEGIEVSDAEVEARIERIASERNVDKDALRKQYNGGDLSEDIRNQMLEQKVVSFLHNSAIKE